MFNVCRNLQAIVRIADPPPLLFLSCFLGPKCPYFWLVDFMFAPFGFNLVVSARCQDWKYPRYILLPNLILGYIFDNDSCTRLFSVRLKIPCKVRRVYSEFLKDPPVGPFWLVLRSTLKVLQ